MKKDEIKKLLKLERLITDWISADDDQHVKIAKMEDILNDLLENPKDWVSFETSKGAVKFKKRKRGKNARRN